MIKKRESERIREKWLKYADDKSDAFFLAELLRLGILPTGHICNRQWRPVRDLLRRRMALVQKRTSLLLSLKSLHRRTFGEDLTQAQAKALTPQAAASLFEDSCDGLVAQVQTQLLQQLTEGIEQFEKTLLEKVGQLPFFPVLESLPGVGRILSLTIALETVDPGRFAGPGNFASYCRCVDSRRMSNGKKKGENNQKSGNKYLAWAFVEAANFARRYDDKCRKYFDRKAAQTSNVIATKALACKLAKAAWHMMSQQVPYDESRVFPGPAVASAQGKKKAASIEVSGAPIGGDQSSPLRAATGGAASEGSKARPRRSPAPANKTARLRAGK